MKVFWILGACISAALLPVPAVAQQDTDADFSRYCATKYPNSTHQRIGLAHYCRQPGQTGGATQHNINLAEACRMTTGSDSYRRVGSRILCQPKIEATDSDPGERTLSAADFQAYCRSGFPNSTYEKRAESWGVVHYCRRPGSTGGFTLQNVDLAKACRLAHAVSGYREETGAVVCYSSNESRTTARQVPAPTPRPTPRPLPPVPPPGPEALPQPVPVPPDFSPNQPTAETETAQIDRQMMANACHAVGGSWRRDTIPLVSDILTQMNNAVAARQAGCANLGGGAEQCRQGVKVEQTVAAYFQTIMIWQCHIAVVRQPEPWSLEDIRAARHEACRIQETLDGLQEVINQQVGTMPLALYRQTLDKFELDDPCAVGELKLVRADGTVISDAQALPLFEPFYIEVHFDRKMRQPRRTVRIHLGTRSKEVMVVRRNGNTYRSQDPIYVYRSP